MKKCCCAECQRDLSNEIVYCQKCAFSEDTIRPLDSELLKSLKKAKKAGLLEGAHNFQFHLPTEEK